MVDLPRRWRRAVPAVAVVLAAGLVRAVHLALLLRGGYVVDTDGVQYIGMAESLLAGRGLTDVLGHPHDHFPPGYPALIALLGPPLGGPIRGAVSLSLLGGMGACLFTYLCLLRLRLQDRRIPRWAPPAAGLLLAVHPLAVGLSCRVQADAPFAAMVVGAVLLNLVGRQCGMSGCTLGSLYLAAAAYLVKPEGLAYFCLLALWEFVWPTRGDGLHPAASARPRFRGRLHAGAGAAAALALLVAPYAWWISHQKGRPTLTGKSATWIHGFDERGFENFVRLNFQLSSAGDRVVVAESAPGEAPSLRRLAIRYASNLKRLWRALCQVLPFGSVWLALGGALWLATRRSPPSWVLAWGTLLLPMGLVPLFFVVPRLLHATLPVLLVPVALAPAAALSWDRRVGRLLLGGLVLLGAGCLTSGVREAMATNVPSDFWATLSWMQRHVEPGEVVVAGKPQLAFHSRAIHLSLPFTDAARLARYMCLNRARWLVLGAGDVGSRPPLLPMWEGDSEPFRLVFATAASPRFELRVYRLDEEPSPCTPGDDGGPGGRPVSPRRIGRLRIEARPTTPVPCP